MSEDQIALDKESEKAAAEPAPEKQIPPPRYEVIICGKSFWCEGPAMQVMMLIEANCRNMDKAQFANFIARYKLSISVWKSETGNEQIMLCRDNEVLGDWAD